MSKENITSDTSFATRLAAKAGAAATATLLVACATPGNGSASAPKASAAPVCERGAVTGFYVFGEGDGINNVLAAETVVGNNQAIIDGTVCYDLARADVQSQINKIEKHSQTSDAFPHPHDQVTTYNYKVVQPSNA